MRRYSNIILSAAVFISIFFLASLQFVYAKDQQKRRGGSLIVTKSKGETGTGTQNQNDEGVLAKAKQSSIKTLPPPPPKPKPLTEYLSESNLPAETRANIQSVMKITSQNKAP